MTAVSPAFIPAVIRKLPYALFSLLFPDDCRICGQALTQFSSAPVCASCLRQPAPLVAEHFCVSCRTPFQNRFPLDSEGRCGLCRSGMRGFDSVYCFGAYEGTLRRLIHLFKYGRMRPLAKPLGDHLASALPGHERFDVLVPVPLHWRRQWWRGFNQSELLARFMARRCGIPMLKVVRRQRATQAQAGLSNSKRRENVAKAFVMKRGRSVEGLRVLLVDDVMTTGATASACALVLKRAGAKSVAMLTLARVDRRMSMPATNTESEGN